jgi:hypothetical protein
LREICAFIQEYYFLFPADEFNSNSCIVMASLESSSGTEGSWEGKLGALKVFLSKQMLSLEDRIGKKISQVNLGIEKQQKMGIELKNANEMLNYKMSESHNDIMGAIGKLADRLDNQEANKS